jgi:hypothetical protein
MQILMTAREDQSMKKILTTPLLIACALLATAALAFAQGASTLRTIQRDAPRPRQFTQDDVRASGTGLPTWTGSFVHNAHTYDYTMVGSDPSQGSVKTVVPTYVIPLKLTFADGTIFDATAPMIKETISAVQAIKLSPIFQPAPFNAGSVFVGKTQYTDAFQRGNFWSSVSTVSPNYHMLVSQPIVLPVQAYNVPAADGQIIAGPYPGTKRGILSQTFIDNQITGPLFAKFSQITPSTFTIFLTYNVFPGGAYGYHDVFGSSTLTGLTYAYVSYLEPYKQLIDADISTLAHEVAEWMDDPYVANNTPCGLLEVGDPLSSTIFEVKLNGIVWHPQDLAFLGYFSFDASQSVNDWLTFRNTITQSCH